MNFDQGEIRIGSGKKGNSAHFHMLCLDATLPDPRAMLGWSDLTKHDQGIAQTLYESYRSARSGDADVQAPKRQRQARLPRSIQMQLPWASSAQSAEFLSIDAAQEAPTAEDTTASPPALPTLAADDEGSNLDDADDLPPGGWGPPGQYGLVGARNLGPATGTHRRHDGPRAARPHLPRRAVAEPG